MDNKEAIVLLLDLEGIHGNYDYHEFHDNLGAAHIAFIEFIEMEQHLSHEAAAKFCFSCLVDPEYKLQKEYRRKSSIEFRKRLEEENKNVAKTSQSNI